MTCGCSALETSPLLTGGGKKKRTTSTKKRTTSTKKRTTSTKKHTTSTKKRTTSTKKRTTRSKKRMSGGGAELPESLTGTRIPLRVQSSPDWHMPGTSTAPPYAIDIGEAMQSYLFGRPTPDGKDFMVASGLVERSKNVIDMVGGKKKKRVTKGKKRVTKSKKRVTKGKKRTTRK